MGISFHCQKCKKRIKAPDGAGGKWGACPNCDHRCYIPLPPAKDDEEIKLAAIDPNEESRYEELMRETHNITNSLLHNTEEAPPAAQGPFTEDDKKFLTKTIILYLSQMATGDLEAAEKTLRRIARMALHARKILSEIANAEKLEPELASITPKVLKGLINNLEEQLDGR